MQELIKKQEFIVIEGYLGENPRVVCHGGYIGCKRKYDELKNRAFMFMLIDDNKDKLDKIHICEHQGHCFIKHGRKIVSPCTVCGCLPPEEANKNETYE